MLPDFTGIGVQVCVGTAVQVLPEYAVRRRDGGIWEVKRTADTLAREVDDLTNNLETCDETEREELAAELKELQSATWEPMDGEIAAPLESQYQRFILHYSAV